MGNARQTASREKKTGEGFMGILAGLLSTPRDGKGHYPMRVNSLAREHYAAPRQDKKPAGAGKAQAGNEIKNG